MTGQPADRLGHVTYVAFGSNLGDRHANIQGALATLGQTPGVDLEQTSTLRETAPVGGPRGQGDYLNGVARLRTSLGPQDLLGVLQAIERNLGRERAERWGPRTLDLDLLLYNDAVIHTERLVVPHPRMHERRFVLEPLCEIAPEVVHPALGLTARQLLERLP